MTRNIADNASNPDKTVLIGTDRIPLIDSEVFPSQLKETSILNLISAINVLNFYTPKTNVAGGVMLNGKIVPSVSSNNLTVALKTLAGTDPTSSDPVFVNINGTIQMVTAATSVTLNAGTNWMNLGATELATLEHDLFAYLVWDSNSSVVALSFARIPYGRVVSDFSSTSTNSKYLANYANFTASDDVTVIGRFAATLSAGAGYTWSVPTFTNANLIQEPIYETRWQNWSPTYSASGSMTYGTLTSNTARYRIIGNTLFFKMWAIGTTGGVASNTLIGTLPIDRVDIAIQVACAGVKTEAGATRAAICYIANGTNSVFLQQYDLTNWGLGADRRFNASGVCEV